MSKTQIQDLKIRIVQLNPIQERKKEARNKAFDSLYFRNSVPKYQSYSNRLGVHLLSYYKLLTLAIQMVGLCALP